MLSEFDGEFLSDKGLDGTVLRDLFELIHLLIAVIVLLDDFVCPLVQFGRFWGIAFFEHFDAMHFLFQAIFVSERHRELFKTVC